MTIYDIARACDVSIATVSRVLNGSNKVRPLTRAKVLAAMRAQNYTPNPFARGLGLDSIDILEIAMVVSKRYGFPLRSDDEHNTLIFSSLDHLAQHIAAHRTL